MKYNKYDVITMDNNSKYIICDVIYEDNVIYLYYDKEGKNVISYTEVNTYVYKEAQTTENKERYEKWYNCANFKNIERIQKCDSSWTNDKEYKVVKNFTEKDD